MLSKKDLKAAIDSGKIRSVSRKHLHRYVGEFAFRYNTRELEDGERTRRAIVGAQGKRLIYKAPLGTPLTGTEAQPS